MLFLTHSNHRNGTIRTLVNADALVTAQRLADDAWVCRSREGGEDTLFCGRLLGEWYRNDHGMGKGYEFPSWFIYSTRLVWAARMLVMGCPSKSHTVKPTSRWCPRTKSIRKCRWEIYIFQMVVDSQGICMMIMIFFPAKVDPQLSCTMNSVVLAQPYLQLSSAQAGWYWASVHQNYSELDVCYSRVVVFTFNFSTIPRSWGVVQGWLSSRLGQRCQPSNGGKSLVPWAYTLGGMS